MQCVPTTVMDKQQGRKKTWGLIVSPQTILVTHPVIELWLNLSINYINNIVGFGWVNELVNMPGKFQKQNGRSVRQEWSAPYDKRSGASKDGDQGSNTRLFVGNLSWEVQWQDLKVNLCISYILFLTFSSWFLSWPHRIISSSVAMLRLRML